MNSVYLVEAKYMDNYRVYLKFNTGESGIVDLEDLIMNYKAAEPLQDRQKFSEFFLDSWPTLAWECGFDVAPESLYYRLTKTVAPGLKVA
ncbi:DUF2442 domain-containing protein [Desulfonatronovibrio magnus]|uniref:DUF2442 domain-containing protein n=1 Tax=Desulfonatronovibrio magnus TaxID=698827 RepID=UPI0005EB2D91|nr:DUF2442 domain-containing protein [Desulfonatronovibrio magnus]